MNYSRFLNTVSLARKPSPIRRLVGVIARSPPSVISFAGGNPNPLLFPFQEAEFKLRDGTVLKLSKERMNVALQYSQSQGIGDLLIFLQKLLKKFHSPPTLGISTDESALDVCVTSGSADGICKTFEMLVESGDDVLIEEPTYAGSLAALRPLGGNLIAIKTDHHGMIPDSLRSVLSRYQPSARRVEKSLVPKFMYTIPNGCNPTGGSLTLERKQEIYQIAREYDILILEDDPYYFLQYTKPRVPSYLSLDVDGRVIRFDSFSKILSSGLRIGFTSGPRALIERITYHVMASSLHTSTLSQVMVYDLLSRWDIEGLEQHVDTVVEFYRSQKDLMVIAAKKYLTGIAEWSEPSAGMFLWIKLLGIADTKKLVDEKALAKEVILVPGCAFLLNPDEPSQYVRASFSIATPEKIDTGFQRLAELIKDEQREIKSNGHIKSNEH